MILSIAQIVVATILIVLIILQERGGGLSQAFGGGSEFYGARRGFEKWLFYITVVIAFLFWGLSILGLIFR